MAFRSDCSLSTAAVCWHDAPAMAPSAQLSGWSRTAGVRGRGGIVVGSARVVGSGLATRGCRTRSLVGVLMRVKHRGKIRRACANASAVSGRGGRRSTPDVLFSRNYFAGVTGPLWRVLLLVDFCD